MDRLEEGSIKSNLPPLFVNDGLLDAEQVRFLRPTDPHATSMEEVRRRLREDGYVFLKGLLPRADVLKAREQYFQYLSSTGLLKPGSAPVDGIFDPAQDKSDYPGIGVGVISPSNVLSAKFTELAIKAHAEPWYKDDFCQHPVFTDYISKLTGWGDNTHNIKRTMLRNNTPGNKAIGVHYDYIFLRHGEESVLTAWVPIGDVKINGGGLIYLEKGHEVGAQIEQEFTAKAKLCGMTTEEAKNAFNQNMTASGALTDGPREFGLQHNRPWLVTAYEAGDVVLHNAYTIHASTINHDEGNVIRLGTDLRFVDSSKPWDKQRWDKVFEMDDGL
ncbi:hypothetical protein N8T08_008600 [Aspergillus melleus]|uniref:Uncharacterized protein n=1 Tax=Aspergillus melleus TaxID=138277 RepID=A0ACC3BD75_9EURO|nr:hypothetical protein N8T08_008600 [Aspergillus melleus]